MPRKAARDPVAEARNYMSMGSALDCDEFWREWRDWCEHRREKRATLTKLTVKLQIEWCESIGLKRAIAAIKHTIFKGWAGLQEPVGRNGKPPPPEPNRPSAKDVAANKQNSAAAHAAISRDFAAIPKAERERIAREINPFAEPDPYTIVRRWREEQRKARQG